MSQVSLSGLRPQGAYVAGQCPVVVQNSILKPNAAVDPSPVLQRRLDRGVSFESDLQTDLAKRMGDRLEVTTVGMSGAALIAWTVEQMTAGVEVISRGRLPDDTLGLRAGKPDLLVRSGPGYVPVDVKHHLTLQRDRRGSILVSKVDEPSPERSTRRSGVTIRKNQSDALQLAHYRRMVDACGFGSGSPFGGIIGIEGVLVWYDLDEPMWTTPTKSGGKKRKKRTTMERYDFDFEFRLDIARAALQRRHDGVTELLVEPRRSSECRECRFDRVCSTVLEEGFGDASLLPGLRYEQWRSLRDRGIRTRSEVAALDYRTALLVAGEVNLVRMRTLAEGCDPLTPVSDLDQSATRQSAAIESTGISTAGELLSGIDDLTATLGAFAGEAILNARAVLGDEPVYRRPGVGVPVVPRADIEIDVDMENTEEGVYLWGALVSTRRGSIGFEPGYHPFVAWDLDGFTEVSTFFSFWEWLLQLRAAATEQGLSYKFYVWHESAENTQLRRIASRVSIDLRSAVEDLIASDEWIDLKKVFDVNWINGRSSSLKTVAPLAGFSWNVDHPGGEMSMLRYDEVVKGSESAKDWILEYNRGDVEATAAIRDWLEGEAARAPVIPTSSEKWTDLSFRQG